MEADTGAVERNMRGANTMEPPVRYRNAIVPHIYVDRASDGIAFYKRAFGAEELFRIAHADGRIQHAEISICGSVIMIGDPDDKLYAEPRKLGRCTAGLHIFVDNNNALLRRAVAAGPNRSSRRRTCSMAPALPVSATRTVTCGCC